MDVSNGFELDESRHVVGAGEAADEFLPVLEYSARQVVGYADIQDAGFAGHDVHVMFLHLRSVKRQRTFDKLGVTGRAIECCRSRKLALRFSAQRNAIETTEISPFSCAQGWLSARDESHGTCRDENERRPGTLGRAKKESTARSVVHRVVNEAVCCLFCPTFATALQFRKSHGVMANR